jgi:hypothetical protein
MPFALVVIGLLMIVTGINNTYAQFGAQLQKDSSFLPWALALFVVGALGYINDLRTFSHYFMALILISIVLANKGFFQNLQAAIKSGPVAPQATASSSSSGSGIASAITKALTSSPSSGSGAAPAAGSTSTTSGTGIFGSNFGLF